MEKFTSNLKHMIIGTTGNEWLKDANGKWYSFEAFVSNEDQYTAPVPFTLAHLPSGSDS